jgi:RepB DNA-primase from phage plasmid
MSDHPADPHAAAALYLRALSAAAPPGTLLDVRYRRSGGGFARVFLDARDPDAPAKIVRIGRQTDVYVGCAPRIRRRGTRDDIAPTALLWADCDDPRAFGAVRAFTPKASMIVTSGSLDHAHAYWLLTRPLDIRELEAANRALAITLGADPRCADATRILRVPGTWNHKHKPPRPVDLLHHAEKRYRPVEILTALPALEPSPARGDRRVRDRREHDPLQQIAPAHYTRLLTGRTPDHDGKIACPFHDDDRPSLHVYPTPEQGWTCYGCPTPDGKPLGGDIYTLASRLWDIPTRGSAFLDLQARLDDVFSVHRASIGPADRFTPIAATDRDPPGRTTPLRDMPEGRFGDDRADR